MEIELNLENREELKKSFDEIADICNKQHDQLKEANKELESAKTQVEALTKTVIDLSDAIKATHLILNKKSELFEGDAEMKVIMHSLAHFVTSSGAIKLGVMSNKRKEDE